MDTGTLLLTVMTVTLAAVTVQAWRIGNEPRDVAVLGAFGGLFGVGTVLSAIF